MNPEETFLEIITNGKAFSALVEASDFLRVCPHVSTAAKRREIEEAAERELERLEREEEADL